jgi:hypothetical protein
MAALDRLLGASMGGEPPLGGSSVAGKPVFQALRLFLLYALLWAGAEGLALAMGRTSYPQSIGVLGWFAGLLFIRAWIARHTTAGLKQTIEHHILPYASPAFLEAVTADLERRNAWEWRIGWPILAALACAVAGIAAFASDLTATVQGDTKTVVAAALASPQSWFGILAMFFGFLVSARSVGAAGFYIAFAERLEIETSAGAFVLGAADSPLVQGLAKLGSQVLVFWVLIFLAILSSTVLALPWLDEYGLAQGRPGRNSMFLMFFVPLAGSITLGIGSLVYLRSEAKIRAALRSFTERQMANLQQRMNALLDPLAGRIPADGAEIARLSDWHDRIRAGGRYGSRVGTAVSIALPFLLPAITVVRTLYQEVLAKLG